MKLKLLLATGLTAMTCAGIATPAAGQATPTAPPSYNTCVGSANGNLQQTYSRSCVSVSATGTPFGNWGQGSGASASIINGREDAGGTSVAGPASYTTSWSNGGWDNAASAVSNVNSVSTGSANLSDGTIHGSISNPDQNWGSGFYLGQISDIVTFTNTSGSALTLSVGYGFDGKFTGIVPNAGYASGSVGLALTSPDYTLHYAGTGASLTGGNNGYATGASTYFDAGGGSYGAPGSIALSTFMNAADYTASSSFDLASGLVTGAFSTSLIIPTGQSQLGFALYLSLDCRQRGGASCDFGNTSALTFSALPEGLSFTSGSGVLFAASQTSPTDPGIGGTGAVPEPASWALTIMGFGTVGGAMRRRRRTSATTALA